jgi:hypothetical protein
MRTFNEFIESIDYNQQLQQIMQRQERELEQVKMTGDINQMIQTMERHAAEIKEWQSQLAQIRNNLPPRNPPQLPDELNIDKILGRRH